MLDTEFWNRNGTRDRGHGDDATTLLSVNVTFDDYENIEAAVLELLELRKTIGEELQSCGDSDRRTIAHGAGMHRDREPEVTARTGEVLAGDGAE